MESKVWSLSEVDYLRSNRRVHSLPEWSLGKILPIAMTTLSYWFSFRVSLLVTGSPQFETQDDFGGGDGICAIPQWQCQPSVNKTDPGLVNFDALGLNPNLCNIVNRLRTILNDSSILSLNDLHDLTCFTLHRLFSLPPLTGDDFQHSNISECLRYAVSAFMFVVHGATYYSHAHILRVLVIELECHLDHLLSLEECQDSLLLWLLSVGAAASSGTDKSRWFRGKAAALSAALGIQCWNDVETHLKRVLWLATRPQVLFQQTWEEILTANSPLHSLAAAEDHERI